MRVYVTTVGTPPEAVFNPLWYLAEVYDWIRRRFIPSGTMTLVASLRR